MATKPHSDLEPDVPMKQRLDHATRAVMDGGLPTAIIVRSAMQRGVGPARLVTSLE